MAKPFRCFLCAGTRTKVIPALQRLGQFSPLAGRTICARCGAFVRWGTQPESGAAAQAKSPSLTGPQWTDQTIMPWGAHKDVSLAEVPTAYLAWLAKQPWIGQWPGLATYIEERLRSEAVRTSPANEP